MRFWLLLILGGVLFAPIAAQDSPPEDDAYGVTINTGEVQSGYMLVSLLDSQIAFLLSNDGRVVHYWRSAYEPGLSAYLRDDGTLIRTAAISNWALGNLLFFMNGRVEWFDWAGNLTGQVDYLSDLYVGHHDIEPLPNGNILMIAYDRYSAAEALTAGRKPTLLPFIGSVWSEKIVEINPATGKVVWEWRVWEHLIQEYDSGENNFGSVADNPGKIHLNFVDGLTLADWLHFNSIDYNADLDQILVSASFFGEIWVIDHSISTEEARGTAGDLLYRWGNPEAHNAGSEDEQVIFGQHDAQWIPAGYPGAGNMLMFDNGDGGRDYSRIVEITPPLNADGRYTMLPGKPTLPETITWEYVAPEPQTLFAHIGGGVQRQPNGNTLITDTSKGRIFEVKPNGDIVWEYFLPAAARPFRAERYADLPIFATLDPQADTSAEIGFTTAWQVTCADDTTLRLYGFRVDDAAVIADYETQFGAAAENEWQKAACAEHGGLP